MGCFLLNDDGEVLLEVASGLNFGDALCLEVNESKQSAVLKSNKEKFPIAFVHPSLMLPLKKNRYLFVVERNNRFYVTHSQLAKVVFVS
jgi:hypothetical protein